MSKWKKFKQMMVGECNLSRKKKKQQKRKKHSNNKFHKEKVVRCFQIFVKTFTYRNNCNLF
jgi:hypothetical protein